MLKRFVQFVLQHFVPEDNDVQRNIEIINLKYPL